MLSRVPGNLTASFLIANAYLSEGNTDESVAALRSALAMHPDNLTVHLAVIDTALASGDIDSPLLDLKWQSALMGIPNRFRRVKILYELQQSDR